MKQEIVAAGGAALAVSCDITSQDSVDKLKQTIEGRYLYNMHKFRVYKHYVSGSPRVLSVLSTMRPMCPRCTPLLRAMSPSGPGVSGSMCGGRCMSPGPSSPPWSPGDDDDDSDDQGGCGKNRTGFNRLVETG